MNKLICSLDLEFNQPSGRVIQIGTCIGNLQTGEVVDRFDCLVNPDEQLSEFIVNLCGITQDQVDRACDLPTAYQQLTAWLAPYSGQRLMNPLTWGGGDSAMLREQLGMPDSWVFGRRWIDAKTVYVSWRLANGWTLPSGLARSMTKLNLKFEGRKHNALDDAINTFRIYHKLLQILKKPAA